MAEPRPRPENRRTGDKPIRGFVPPCYVIVMLSSTFEVAATYISAAASCSGEHIFTSFDLEYCNLIGAADFRAVEQIRV